MLIPLVAGAVAGRFLGGRLGRVGELRFRAPALVFFVLGSQALLGRAPKSSRGFVVVVSYLAVGGWIVLNTRARSIGLRMAFALVGVGWAMNFAAMAPTGAMPVSANALTAIGAPVNLNVQDGHLYKHIRRGHRNATSWLGDEIPVPSLKAVISVGDIVLALGIFLLVSSAMLGHVSTRPRYVRTAVVRNLVATPLDARAAAVGIHRLAPSRSPNISHSASVVRRH